MLTAEHDDVTDLMFPRIACDMPPRVQAQFLRLERYRRDLTQADVAQALSMSVCRVRRVERQGLSRDDADRIHALYEIEDPISPRAAAIQAAPVRKRKWTIQIASARRRDKKA